MPAGGHQAATFPTDFTMFQMFPRKNHGSVLLGLLIASVNLPASATVLVEDTFEGTPGGSPDAARFSWSGEVALTGDGQVGFQTWSVNQSWIRSQAGAAVASGETLLLQFTAYAYAEGTSPGAVYGDRQPRGLRVGTDGNNAVEFYSASRTTVGMRARRDGVETTASFSLPAGVDSLHQYEISVTTTAAVFRVDGALAGTIVNQLPAGSLNFYLSTHDGGFGNVPARLADMQLSLSSPVVPIVPAVTTVAATDIVATGTNAVATLNGTVNPHGADAAAWFEWGRTGGYGHQSQVVTVTSNAALSAPASLQAGFPYHYRLVASNSAGCSYGQDMTLWSPRLELVGPDVVTNAFAVSLVEPGVAVRGAPLAVAARFNCSIALKADGTVVAWGNNQPPGGISNVMAMAGGDYTFLALHPDHTITYAGAGTPTTTSNVAAIAAGAYHALVLLNNGTVATWGNNYAGQLDLPPDLTNAIAVAAGGEMGFALRADGAVAQWGRLTTAVPESATNVIALAAGAYHGLALRSNNTVIAWGYNSYGQTNVPADLTNALAVAASGHHSMALRANGQIAGWGWNPYGELSPPAAATNMVEIATGYYHSLGIRDDGTVWCWGLNNQGQTVTPTNLMTLSLPVATIGSVDSRTPGTYTLTYRTTNQIGAVAQASRTVVVAAPIVLVVPPQSGGANGFQFNLTNLPGTSFTVLGSTNLALPLGEWTVLGSMTEAPAGVFQFTDTMATNRPAIFYRVRSP